MSQTIDQRVVEMRFDNKQFESGTAQTLSTLQKLKAALNFSDSAESLKGLEKSVNDVRLDGITAGVAALEKRFSTLGIIGMQVIQNITNAMTNTLGKGIAFINDAIIGGGIRRATNLENAHFQLQSLLKDEERVQEVMNSANKSVDGTAYSFDVAAKAASQFTASGVTSVDSLDRALRALAGTTATYNADYEQMAMIFTQVAGQGRLMGDQLLQLSSRGANAAATLTTFFNGVNNGSIEVSDSVKSAIQAVSTQTDLTEGEIRDFVSKSKISFDIFTAAMDYAFGDSAARANETFNGALANIKAAFARIGAGFVSPLIEQNSALVTLFNTIRVKVNEVKSALVFDEAIGNVNALSKQFTDFVIKAVTSLDEFISKMSLTEPLTIFYNGVHAITDILGYLSDLISPIGLALKESFGSFFNIDILEMSRNLVNFAKNLKVSEETSNLLKTAFKGIFDVGRFVADTFVRLLKTLSPLSSPLSSLANLFLKLAANIGQNLTNLTKTISESKLFNAAFDTLSFVVSNFSSVLTTVIDHLQKFIATGEGIPMIGSYFKGLFENLGNAHDAMKIASDGFVEVLTSLLNSVPNITSVIGKLGDAFVQTIEKILYGLGSKGFNGIFTTLSSIFTLQIISEFRRFITNIAKIGKSLSSTIDKIGGVFSNFSGIFSNISNTLKTFQTETKSKAIRNIAISIGVLAASLVAISTIDPDKLASSLGAMAVMFGDLVASTLILDRLTKTTSVKLVALSASLISFSISIGILSVALKTISTIDPDRLRDSLLSITALILELSAVEILLSTLGGKLNTGVLSIIALASAIVILTNAVKKLSDLNIEQLIKGLSGVTVLLIDLAAFMAAAKFGELKVTQAAAIVVLAEALVILQGVVSKFGSLDVDSIIKGLSSVTLLLASIAGFNFASGQAKNIKSSAVSILAIAKALIMLQAPMVTFGNMSWESIGKGLTGIGVSLGEIVLAMRHMPSNIVTTSASLIAISVAIGQISKSFKNFGNLSLGDVVNGLIGIGGALGIIVIALNNMKGTLAGSAAVLVMAGALSVLTPVIKTMGNMSWESLAKGLIGMAGAFTILGAAALVLSPVSPAILALSASVALLGVAIAAATVAITAFLVVLTNMQLITASRFTAMIDTVKTIAFTIVESITEAMPLIGELIKELINTICDVVLSSVPKLVDTFLSLVSQVLSLIEKNVGPIVSSLLNVFLTIVDELRGHIPTIVIAVVGLFTDLFSSIVQALKTTDSTTLVDAISGVGILAGLMTAFAGLSVIAVPAMIGVLAAGAVVGEIAILMAAFGALAQIPGFSWIVGEGGNLLAIVGTKIGEFLGGFVSGVLVGVTSDLPKMGTNLSDFITNLEPFLSGLTNINVAAVEGVKNLADMILTLTIADVINSITAWFTGGNSIVKFGQQLAEFGPYISEFANSISGGINESAVQAAANSASIMAAMAKELPSTDGWLQTILGSKDIGRFGEDLAEFGPDLMTFVNSISDGINESAVQTAANAATMMAVMTKELPSTDGWLQTILGSKDLSGFGKALNTFGPDIMTFANAIGDGINESAVQTAANAATMMAVMTKELPSTDGWLQTILGSKDVAKFGESLKTFGPDIAIFAESISGIKADVVQNSANAAMALAELASKLPNSGGLVSFFTGDNDIGKFGESLKKFGFAFSEYHNSVSGINTSTLRSVATEFENLVRIATGVSSIDTSGMSRFSQDLTSLGKAGIDEFIRTFTDAQKRATDSINSLISAMISSANNRSKDFKSSGESLLRAFTDAFDSYRIQSSFMEIGRWISTSMAKGVESNMSVAVNAAIKLANQMEEGIRNVLEIHSISPKFKTVGNDVDRSLRAGIESGSKDLINTAQGVMTTLTTIVTNPIYEAYNENPFGGLFSNMSNSVRENGSELTSSVTGMFNNVVGAINSGNEDVSRAEESGNDQRRVSSQNTKQIQNERVVAEKGFWESLLEAKRAGADAEKYMEMDIAEFQKQTLSDVVDVLQDYADQMQSARDSLMGSLDLFSEISEKEAKNKYELQANLQSQIREYENYTETLTSLNERLGDSALGDYLRTLSVDSLAQLEVLNEMTDDELQTYSGLYDTRMAAATEAASAQLYGLRQETESKLSEIFGSMNTQVNLYDFASVFDGSIQSIEKYVNDLNTKFQTFNQDAQTLGAAFPQNLSVGVEGGMEGFVTNVGGAINTALQTIGAEQSTNATEAGKGIGSNLDAGVGTGMTESTAAQESAKQLMDNVLNALTAAGEIHSPSLRTNREVGVPLVEGIGTALSETTEPIQTGANALGQNLISMINTAVSDRFAEITSTMKTLGETIANGIKSNLPQSDITNNGVNIVTWIIKGIQSKNADLLSTVKKTCDDTVRKFKISLIVSDFKPNGVNIITWIMQGMESMLGPLEGMIQRICNDIVEWIREKLDLDQIRAAGQSVVEALREGLESNAGSLVTVCTTISSNVISTLSGKLTYSAGYSIGANFSAGLAAGIASRRSSSDDDDDDPVDAAEDLADSMCGELENDLDINSPSKRTFKYGVFFSQGLALGILNGAKYAKDAVAEVADDTVKVFTDAVREAYNYIENTNVDTNPVITPIVDLSEVKRGAFDISNILSDTYNLSTRDKVLSAAAVVRSTRSVASASTETGNKNEKAVEQKFEFVQNNYSPKALSRSDIYRQTNNQFTAFKNSVAMA